MLLWDRDNRSYSYFVEVSVEQSHWDRVIDYTMYKCRSFQHLCIPSQPIRYIKLVGIHNTENPYFHVVDLKALYTENVPVLFDHVVSATENVAALNMGAAVIKGERNDMLNGYFNNYDDGLNYTSSSIGNQHVHINHKQLLPIHIFVICSLINLKQMAVLLSFN